MTIDELKTEIGNYIYSNFNGEISGNILRDVLLDMVDTIGGGRPDIGLCVEDGIFFVDESLNIGAQINSDGFSAINLITMEEI